METPIADLRARIRALEQGRNPDAFEGLPPGETPSVPGGMPLVMPFGVPAIDAHLPEGGLRLAGLHEIAGARDEWDDAVAAGFCLALLGRLAVVRGKAGDDASTAPVLWAARRADLYGPGVAGLLGPRAVHPGRLILVRARRDDEVLWALEEGLRASAGGPIAVVSAVVGEVSAPDGTALRRLQLAAETAGRPCFLLRRRLSAGHAAVDMSTPGAALTRWRIGALPSSEPGRAETGRAETGVTKELTGLPGLPRWRVDLLRCRGAAPGSFTVEWDDAAGDFALAAPVRDRPVAPRAAISAAADQRAG